MKVFSLYIFLRIEFNDFKTCMAAIRLCVKLRQKLDLLIMYSIRQINFY